MLLRGKGRSWRGNSRRQTWLLWVSTTPNLHLREIDKFYPEAHLAASLVQVPAFMDAALERRDSLTQPLAQKAPYKFAIVLQDL